MPYICKNPETFKDRVVGSGQCVAFVQESAKAPMTSSWKQGRKVRGPLVLRWLEGVKIHMDWIHSGTAIATFADGKYPNADSGNHAAIYISQDASGIWVWDQWAGQPVHKRLIRFKGGRKPDSEDGDTFAVIR